MAKSFSFSELIQQSKRITRDEFAANFGGIADDVVEMLDSEQARRITHEAREKMEVERLPSGAPALRQLEFGLFSTAPELERGEVAAVDGTTPLPIQLYSAGQALCVGIGSLSHRRPMQDSLHYWSSRVLLSEARDSDDFLSRMERGIFGISQTAYLRYFEVAHGLEIQEPHIFFDGPIVYEWLLAPNEGVNLYENLFRSQKKCIGVMKNIKANADYALFARALRTGELYVIETLDYHLENSNAPNKNQGESARRLASPEFRRKFAAHILRGIFKPKKKAFGFEVHEDHFEDMIRIMAADCQMNHVGHEIPYLLNRVDEEVRRNFTSQILKDRIAVRMATQSEELFLEETNERDLR